MAETKDIRTMYFIDIDETLFRQKNTVVYVKDFNGKVVKELTNEEFNNYKLPPGYTYDHHEFRSGKHFVENAVPIQCVIDWFKQRILENKNLEHPDMFYILTARGDFDDKNLVLDFFDKQGIPIRKYNFVDFIRTGNISDKIPVNQKKAVVGLYGLLDTKYNHFVMVDDSISNLEDFYKVKSYSGRPVEFDVIHVIHDKINCENTNYQMIPVKDADILKYIDIYKAKRTLAKWGVNVDDKSIEHIKVGKRTVTEAKNEDALEKAKIEAEAKPAEAKPEDNKIEQK